MEEITKFEGQIRKGGWAAAAQIAEQFFRNNHHVTPWLHEPLSTSFTSQLLDT